MKRILIIIVSFCALTTNAQNYLISFAGTGASTSVSSVKVENLTAGSTLTLNGSDVLGLTIATGVNSVEDNQLSVLKIYPNPMTNYSVLKISPTSAGEAIISVLDISGKLLIRVPIYLDNYPQEFRISGLKSGVYLISVKGDSFLYSKKLLCNSKEAGIISIEKISNNRTADGKILKKDSKGFQSSVNMTYTIGDRLKFTGISGIYSTVKIDIPTSDKTITFNFMACTDGDNNNYPVVEIGTQVWMGENLKTTKYSNGTDIPLVPDNGIWSLLNDNQAEGYCWYDNDPVTYKTPYGALYNWYAINTGKLCPAGWHVPSDAEWHTLVLSLDAEALLVEGDESIIAGDKLKEKGNAHWLSPYNTNATNESGFTALPSGWRSLYGDFNDIGNTTDYFTSTELSSDQTGNVWYRILGADYEGVARYQSCRYSSKCYGFSIRCVKN